MLDIKTDWDFSVNMQTLNSNNDKENFKITGRFDPIKSTEGKIVALCNAINNMQSSTLVSAYLTAKKTLDISGE